MVFPTFVSRCKIWLAVHILRFNFASLMHASVYTSEIWNFVSEVYDERHEVVFWVKFFEIAPGRFEVVVAPEEGEEKWPLP